LCSKILGQPTYDRYLGCEELTGKMFKRQQTHPSQFFGTVTVLPFWNSLSFPSAKKKKWVCEYTSTLSEIDLHGSMYSSLPTCSC